ncbi:hypothetical protein C8F01DRAFT_769821 [Mycena amicta]|nr:hypothetical protein C8F01DRAFT_769821 [Mycena amicta]
MSPPACWNCNAPMFPWDEDACWNCNALLLPWDEDVAPDRDYGVSSSWTGAHSAPARSYQLPQSPPRRVPRTLVSPPPPAPHLGSIPLPTDIIQLHPLLTPDHALELQLDFSLPPAQFIATPSLTENLLGAPASRSLSTVLTVRISTPEEFPVLFKTCLEVRHRGGTVDGDGVEDFVTVGDILATIYRSLRDRNGGWPPEYRLISSSTVPAETLETVNAYASRRIEKLYALGISAQEINAELEAGLRVVDRCAGHVLFAGLRVHTDPEDPLRERAFRVALVVPEDGLPGRDELPQSDVPPPLGFLQPFAAPARLQALSPLIM